MVGMGLSQALEDGQSTALAVGAPRAPIEEADRQSEQRDGRWLPTSRLRIVSLPEKRAQKLLMGRDPVAQAWIGSLPMCGLGRLSNELMNEVKSFNL